MSIELTPSASRRLALFPWGGVVEDYLGPIGTDRRTFAMETSGGWLFGFAEALRRHNIATTIFGFSSGVEAPERHLNHKTGVATLYLPLSPVYRQLRRWPGDADDIHRPRLPGKIVRLFSQGLVRYFATHRPTVAAALQSEGCTMILAQEYEHPRFDVLMNIGRRLGIPVFATYQGAPPPDSILERNVRRRTIRHAAGLVVASGHEVARLRVDYGLAPRRIAQIPNPLDLDLWQPQSRASCRAALDLPDNALVVVSHGRIDLHRKGLDVLLIAWRRLAAAHPDVDLRLHLVGSGQDDAVLARQLDRAPVPGLRWVRRFVNDRSELQRELGAADAYVLASRHEGFPVAPLEALACGIPVVAANAPGVAEILPRGEADGGIVVPTDNPVALQEAVERLLFEPGLRVRLGARGRSRVAEFCSLDAVGGRLARFLSSASVASRASLASSAGHASSD